VADQKPAVGDDRLAALQELELTHDDPMEDLDRLVLLAADICSASLAAFTVHDATTAREVSSSFGARASMPKQECMCSTLLASNQTLYVPDATSDPRLASTRYVAGAPFVRSFVGVPIGIEPGLPIGVLAIGHTETERFGALEIERLTRVSELVAAFLSQRRAAIRATRAAKTTEADRQRQHLFELIFNAIQEGVNVQSARRGVVEMNPACLSIMGLTREDAMSRIRTDPRWRTFRPDGSLYSPDEFPAFVTLRSGKAFQNEQLGIELPDGGMRWLSVNTVPLRHAETNEVEFAVVTMKDVTDQRLAEAQLMAQNTQLAEALELTEKASRAKTDFMGVMSHELRTPMNAITGCALLISQSTLDPVQRRTLGVLEDAGKQMLAVLNDLFDLSALNADKVRIEVEPVSMLRLIEDAAVKSDLAAGHAPGVELFAANQVDLPAPVACAWVPGQGMWDQPLGDGMQALQLGVTFWGQCVFGARIGNDLVVLLPGVVFEGLSRHEFADTRCRAHFNLRRCAAGNSDARSQNEAAPRLPTVGRFGRVDGRGFEIAKPAHGGQ
jgi:PAS domain S-box-containing protein